MKAVNKEQFLQTLAQLTADELAHMYNEARQKYERKTVFDTQKEQEANDIAEAFRKHKVRR